MEVEEVKMRMKMQMQMDGVVAEEQKRTTEKKMIEVWFDAWNFFFH